MDLTRDGFEILSGFLPASVISNITEDVSNTHLDIPEHGIRNAEKKFPSIDKLVNSTLVQDKASEMLGSKAAVVRVLFFNKTKDTNWAVAWHQDKTIAVNKKIPIPDWGPWSLKDGVHHVQPELALLNQMITFRLHLDDANENTGCLKVIPGSHQLGIVPQSDMPKIAQQHSPYHCIVKAGDALIMRPHLLHASAKSTSPSNRRVVHIEFSDYPLPKGLTWI